MIRPLQVAHHHNHRTAGPRPTRPVSCRTIKTDLLFVCFWVGHLPLLSVAALMRAFSYRHFGSAGGPPAPLAQSRIIASTLGPCKGSGRILFSRFLPSPRQGHPESRLETCGNGGMAFVEGRVCERPRAGTAGSRTGREVSKTDQATTRARVRRSNAVLTDGGDRSLVG